jgi:DNA-binding transcriptional MocR family regulator
MSDDSSSRVVADLRHRIGTAVPGDRLPSTRALVERHRASPATVQRALRILADEGLVERRPGAGTFVRATPGVRAADHSWQTGALRAPPARARPVPATMRPAPDGVIALHSGYPDRELLPERLVRGALARAARGAAALSRPPVAGLPELRAWFAHQLAERTPAGVNPATPGDVVVLPGSQSGLASLFRALVGAGRPLLVESPTYWGAIAAAEQAGVQVVPVAGDRDGPDPGDLDRGFRETGARLCYVQPTYANPTGAQWPPARREQVLDVARRHGAFVVEDDWAHDLAIDTAAVPLATCDDAGHVVYLRSLTKSVSPALRVAAVVARGPARERVLADRGAESLYVSAVLQAAALDVVTQPAWGTHLRGLRRQLRARRDLLVASLQEHAPTVRVERMPAGGLHLWVRLPDGVDPDPLALDCERAGLLVVSGREWFPAEPTAPYLRLNFSGPDPGAFPAAARILGAAVDRALGER